MKTKLKSPDDMLEYRTPYEKNSGKEKLGRPLPDAIQRDSSQKGATVGIIVTTARTYYKIGPCKYLQEVNNIRDHSFWNHRHADYRL